VFAQNEMCCNLLLLVSDIAALLNLPKRCHFVFRFIVCLLSVLLSSRVTPNDLRIGYRCLLLHLRQGNIVYTLLAACVFSILPFPEKIKISVANI
jgi:hypothetical protein